jgi:pSer/pThr/pTyr-binding forkhead associated (FHA) protein
VDKPRPSPHLASPVELKARIEAERVGDPFVLYRDADGEQRIVPMGSQAREVTIGRHGECDVLLDWDERVSGLHAELRSSAGHWLVVDDGLSRNGTFANGERVAGRRRLHDGDQVEVGATMLIFREPGRRRARSTAVMGREGAAPELSPAQRRVLVQLCRPFAEGSPYATPATNQQIAEELHLSVSAVKTHLRALFQRFGIGELPHNEKRAALVQAALDTGAVLPVELGRP